ncbi:Protein SYM1 [Vanrija pseudolonga]|uniref:Protein SYM1 n=1 Tax=Vanrija pseudolonga TaxID=143232 RepID=A0AAF0Y5N3_9TREE|nr:Protein SYM1 [Vanrija pseudolonga]
MTSTAAVAPTSLGRRVLAAYLRQLSTRPLRTKMITSTVLFSIGDSIAQFGIEGRRLGADGSEVDQAGDPIEAWDPQRAARLAFYGGFIFAPLAHNWLGFIEKIKYPSKIRTLATRLAVDQFLWGPFIVCMFWGCNGILEGKSIPEVKQKVEMAFLPVYMRSMCVFGPTAAINFTLIPPQHRLTVAQIVGLGWNTYLSYLNHVNNKRMAEANAALTSAQALEAGEKALAPDLPALSSAEVEAAEAAIGELRKRREKIRGEEGGGATGAGTRMGVA